MKFKLLILATCISVINIMCCGSDYVPLQFEYLPTGKVSFTNNYEKYHELKDTIRGPYEVYLDFDTKQLYAFNFSLVPTAVACKIHDQPSYFNPVNREKLKVSINKDFIYKDDVIVAHFNIIDLDFSSYKNFFYAENNRIRFDEKFLYYAKFIKGWTTFYISGELEDGQKFKFEKEVYLDL